MPGKKQKIGFTGFKIKNHPVILSKMKEGEQ